MSKHELAKAASMPIQSMDDLARLAEMFAKSGYFTDAKSAAQIGVKVLAGREMGFGPFASVNGVHVIQGKPAVGANLMAAAVRAHGRYDYAVNKMQDDVVEIEFLRDGKSIGVSKFDAKDAKAAGTANLGKFPRNMLFARAMSNGVRWYCPDVFMGSSVYTPEELGAEVDGDGDVIPESVTVQVDEEYVVASTKDEPVAADDPEHVKAVNMTRTKIASAHIGDEADFAGRALSGVIVESLDDLSVEQLRTVYKEAASIVKQEQEEAA
jgi:hypothetical protein